MEGRKAARQGAPRSPRSDGHPVALAVRGVGDHEAEELARDDRESVVQGGARGRQSGAAAPEPSPWFSFEDPLELRPLPFGNAPP